MLTVDKFATWYWVSSIPYLGPVRFKKLWETLDIDIAQIFEMDEDELKKLKGIVTSQIIIGLEKVRNKRNESRDFAEKQIELASKFGAGILLLDDERYPKFLKESKMCHPILYYKGNIQKFRDYTNSLAIVGSRKALDRSMQIAKETAFSLAKSGWVIVAGMAKGIDTQAHIGALEARGRTIGVVGSGVDYIYPTENKNLYERMWENNLIVSEFPLGTKPEDWKLQKRNKTIVALARGIFVVQSSIKGGAMNAVKACFEQKKPIFTIKGGNTADFSGNAKILQDNGIAIGEKILADSIKNYFAHNPNAGLNTKNTHGQ
jgi:DNA processing protein